jgi:hypothetical protein
LQDNESVRAALNLANLSLVRGTAVTCVIQANNAVEAFKADPRLAELKQRLAAIDADALTPRQALDLLYELVSVAKDL